MSTESGWVIEHQRSQLSAPEYWGGGYDWYPDNMKAIRFARKVDAERVRSTLDMDDYDPELHRVCGHSWG